MVRRIGSVLAGLAVLATGCGDDNNSNTTTDTGGDTSTWNPPPGLGACEPGSGTDTKSGLTCVETAVNVTPIEPNPACTQSDSVVTGDGLAYPWAGATIAGTNFTCNGCPNGLPELQGRFRVHGFKPDSDEVDYSQPDPATDYASILFVEGNTFYVATHDARENSTTWSRGYYFCSMKLENGAKHIYWNDLDSSESASVGNWTRTDTILSQGGGKNLLIKFFGSTNTADARGIDFPYCKIGTSTDGQVCSDPFAN